MMRMFGMASRSWFFTASVSGAPPLPMLKTLERSYFGVFGFNKSSARGRPMASPIVLTLFAFAFDASFHTSFASNLGKVYNTNA